MKGIHIIILGFLLAIAACAKQSAIPPFQEDVLYQMEEYYLLKPDSALKILDTLNTEVLSEKEQAHFCLLKVKIRDRFFLYDSITDSLMRVAENYFIGSKDKWFETQTCEALSRIAFKEGKGEQIKLDWLLKAYQSIEQCNQVDKRFLLNSNKYETVQELIDDYKYKIQMRLGMCYLDNDYYKEGLRFLKPVDLHFAEKQQYNERFGSSFMLGNAYLSLKEYDSCRLSFEQGLEAAQKLELTENIAYYHYSMSMLYRYQFENKGYENEEEGRQLLQKAISECYQGLDLYEEPLFKYKDGLYDELGRLYFHLEQYDSCILYSEKRLEFLEQIQLKVVPNHINADNLYRIYKSYEALENKEKAFYYADRYFETKSALENQPKAVEQVKNEYDKKLEMMQLQNEQQIKRYRLYLLLALALIALVLVLWITNRYRKNKEIESLKQAEAYRKLESEFEAASQQSLQALQQRVMAIYKTGKDDRLARIMAEFAASYPSATERIKTTYPDLTESERNIVILSFLGFRTKEEAEILNLSLNTVEKYRTNIKKKAHHEPLSDLIK